MNIRPFTGHDLGAVSQIQLKCPPAAQWREADYLHLARDPLGTIVVAEDEISCPARVVGFAVFHRVMDEAELRNIAVDPAHQRQGVARALLVSGVRTLRESGAHRLFLEVRASNLPALALYESAGFRLLLTRHNYYQDPVEDAQVMVCDLAAPGASSP